MNNSKCEQIISHTNTEQDKRIIAIIRGYCRFCNPNKQKNKYCSHFKIEDEDEDDDEEDILNENLENIMNQISIND